MDSKFLIRKCEFNIFFIQKMAQNKGLNFRIRICMMMKKKRTNSHYDFSCKIFNFPYKFWYHVLK
jgi:hypothetical protein